MENEMYTSMMNNAAFNIMNISNTQMGMLRNADPNQAMNRSLFQKEQSLTMDKMQSELVYNASECMQESFDKMQKDNIKESFSWGV